MMDKSHLTDENVAALVEMLRYSSEHGRTCSWMIPQNCDKLFLMEIMDRIGTYEYKPFTYKDKSHWDLYNFEFFLKETTITFHTNESELKDTARALIAIMDTYMQCVDGIYIIGAADCMDGVSSVAFGN